MFVLSYVRYFLLEWIVTRETLFSSSRQICFLFLMVDFCFILIFKLLLNTSQCVPVCLEALHVCGLRDV